jgi:hypothetical protein
MTKSMEAEYEERTGREWDEGDELCQSFELGWLSRDDMDECAADERIESAVEDHGDFPMLDDFEDQFIGVVRSAGRPAIACYDRTLILSKLMNDEGISSSVALDKFLLEVDASFSGDDTPCFLERY